MMMTNDDDDDDEDDDEDGDEDDEHICFTYHLKHDITKMYNTVCLPKFPFIFYNSMTQ